MHYEYFVNSGEKMYLWSNCKKGYKLTPLNAIPGQFSECEKWDKVTVQCADNLRTHNKDLDLTEPIVIYILEVR